MRISDWSSDVCSSDLETVATAAHGFDRLERALGVELLAQAADEDFDHVGIAVEVLLVDVLGEVGLRDQFAGVHLRAVASDQASFRAVANDQAAFRAAASNGPVEPWCRRCGIRAARQMQNRYTLGRIGSAHVCTT